MAKGTVKWFNDAKGFGFIEQESGGEDVFVHYSTIQTDGYRSLKEGQKVDYEVEGADKGLRAVNVRATSEAPGSGDELTQPINALRERDTRALAQCANSIWPPQFAKVGAVRCFRGNRAKCFALFPVFGARQKRHTCL